MSSKLFERIRFRVENRKMLNYSSEVARRVLAQMEDMNLTKDDLVEQTSMSKDKVENICRGQEDLTLGDIAKLSDVLQIELITFPNYKYS